jgi:hypothetical protein
VFTNLLVNKKVHTKENGDAWRIVTKTDKSGNLDFSENHIDTDIYFVYVLTKIIFMHYHTHCIANFNNISVLVLSYRSVLLE